MGEADVTWMIPPDKRETWVMTMGGPMADDPQHFESVAPPEGDKIVDTNEAISNPQKRATDPQIKGAKDVRKEGVKIVTSRGTT